VEYAAKAIEAYPSERWTVGCRKEGVKACDVRCLTLVQLVVLYGVNTWMDSLV
jgi:hypothetical protein